MTRYPRQVDREYLSCRSGGLNKIQMIDGGTLDLHQDLVACNRRRRYIVEHQLPTVFQQSDSFHANSPYLSNRPHPKSEWILTLTAVRVDPNHVTEVIQATRARAAPATVANAAHRRVNLV